MRRIGRRGASRVGCLFLLLLVAVGVYYGVAIGETYFDYFRLQDAMKAEARSAVNVNNATMLRRMRSVVDQLQTVPDSAGHFDIRRTARPREVVITTGWSVTWVLPFYTYDKVFLLEVRAPI